MGQLSASYITDLCLWAEHQPCLLSSPSAIYEDAAVVVDGNLVSIHYAPRLRLLPQPGSMLGTRLCLIQHCAHYH